MEIFVPGRLCVLGEHTDWIASYGNQNPSIKEGYTLVCATNEGLFARVHDNIQGKIKIRSVNHKEEVQIIEEHLDYENLRRLAGEGGFFSYAFGTAAYIILHPKFLQAKRGGDEIAGIYIDNYHTTLPLKKGLSSSAAICVLTAMAFNKHFNLSLNDEELMEVAYQGENLTPSRCGRMDQCVVMGAGAIALMRFSISGCQLQRLRSKETLHFVVVDLKASKDTVEILTKLNDCFPFANDEKQLAMHCYMENMEKIAFDAQKAIESGDVLQLAARMREAQTLFDQCAMPLCPTQLSSPRLHALIENETLAEMTLAVKGVGSQGDGSAQFLCKNSAYQHQALEYVRSKFGMDGFLLTIPGSAESESV